MNLALSPRGGWLYLEIFHETLILKYSETKTLALVVARGQSIATAFVTGGSIALLECLDLTALHVQVGISSCEHWSLSLRV